MVLQDHRIINLTTGLYCPNGKGHVRTICVGEEANLGGSVYRHSQDSKQEYAHKYREESAMVSDHARSKQDSLERSRSRKSKVK